jgi:predicted Zn finger-like uncharacterized protein
MFTVCPKCSLTLVVTAADLRVAQGYVRCGRCSNVFNALSRLSEDRQAAAPAAQSQASETASTTQQRPDTSGTSRTRITQDPEATGSSRKAQDLAASAKFKQPPDPTASAKFQPPAPDPTPKVTKPSPPAEPKRYGDDSILEEDLEFNPNATDLNKVFVEQPPSPQFTAATGTFKAIRMEAESATRPEPTGEHFKPPDSQVDVEIDPGLLASMADLGPKPREPERAHPTAPPPTPKAKKPEVPPPPAPPRSEPRQPPKQPQQSAPSMRLAERAKARVEAARSNADQTEEAPQTSERAEPQRRSEPRRGTPIETAQAIRDALTPRRRGPAADVARSPEAEPTSFFSGMWTTGSIVLALLLIVQIIHHYRHDLAANPTLNGPLTAIYAALGIPIVPRWDLNAYEVRQLGASTSAEAPGQITVRASVKNGARQAQPLPLLRITLQDQFGNHIASRDVPPQAYLPRAIPSSSLLSAGQRIDAEMTFVDPGSNAVGFEIDACLPAPGGAVACANDALAGR